MAIVVFAEVRKGHIVAAAEALAVFVVCVPRNRRIAEFVSSLRVRGTLILEVAAGGFDAIVEALALNLPELLWRRIPAATIMVLTIALLRVVLGLRLCPEQGGRSQDKNKHWKSETSELHGWIPPCSLCTLAVMVHPDGSVVCKSALSKENGGAVASQVSA